ncbi:MAG: LemA family protein [Candidatus Pacearchaeota archaeon]|nr:LemA family protein [Candidatus Pacearchaeota archaeon]
MVLEWVIVGIVAFAVLVFLYFFNRFAVLGNRIDNSLSQIDVQLKRRADLIPNLIESVKGYVKHEKSVIKEVTDARKALVSAGNIEAKVKANDKLESALKTIFALAENYPDLKANTNFLELQRELATTEDKIAYSRQYYNDSILAYNDLCKTAPGIFFAKLYGKKPREYLHIAESERKNIEVKF